MNRITLHCIALLATLGFACQSASAALINNNTGLAAPTTTITFGTNDFAAFTPITTQYAALGLADAGGIYYDNTLFLNAFHSSTGAYLINFNKDDSLIAPFTLTFGSTQTAVAFVLITDEPITLTAKLGGTTVETEAVSPNLTVLTADFYGFSGISFDSILFTPTGDLRVLIDTLQLGTSPVAGVPEPSSIALGAIGLAGIVALRRRRRVTA